MKNKKIVTLHIKTLGRKTNKLKKYEKFVNFIINKHLEKEDFFNKVAEAIALGRPLFIDSEGHIGVL